MAGVEPRRFYIDVQSRSFVVLPSSTLAAQSDVFAQEDVESIELFFLRPTGLTNPPFEYLDYSSSAVKLAIGTTHPAALQTSWTALTTTITASITSLVTGGGGLNEQQRITFSPTPASGGWALQLPARSVTVSSVSANIFTAADHGLYAGQSVSLTAFSLTNSAVANGSSYFVIRNSKDTFSLASTASSTTALTAAVTSGGGTVELPAITTGQLAYNATPGEVQNALIAAGVSVNGAAQIIVTGTQGREYVLTYANGSANRDYANAAIVGSTLSAPPGLAANLNLNTTDIAALIAAGTTSVSLEVEVSDGTVRQTYKTPASLSSEIISSASPAPVPTGSTSFALLSPDNSQWVVSIDNNGILTAAKQ